MRLDCLVFASSVLVAWPAWALGGEPSSPQPLGTDGAAPAVEATPAASVRSSGLRELTLPSRLRVVLDPEPGASEVTVCTAVDAGARRDPSDKPGAQRLLAETLGRGGFPVAGKDQAELLASRRIRSELFSARDLTTFCTSGPPVELPLVLWVSAGRFTALSLTQKQQAAALERLAQQVEARDANSIDGRAPVRLREMVLLGTPEYAHPELPELSDLESIDLPLLRRLHEEAYVALGSVVTISGSFEPDVAERLLPEQLALVRTGTAPATARAEVVPQSTLRFSMAEDPSIKSPSVHYAWLLPEDAPRTDLELALWTLASPERLGQKLVGPGKAARDLTIDIDTARGPGLLSMRVSGTGPQSLGTIEKALEQELRTLSTVAPSMDELGSVERRIVERRQRLLSDVPSRSRLLSEGVLRGATAPHVLASLDAEKMPAVDGEAVRAATAQFLVPSRQSIVEIYPKGWQDPWQVPMPVFHIVSAGETLTSIAKQHRTTVQAIVKMNGISEKSRIYPGDKLKVPRGKHHEEAKLRTHVVRRGDTLSALGLRYGVSARAIAEQNGMNVKQSISVGETLRIPNPDKGGGKNGKDSGNADSSSKGPSSKGTAPAEAETGAASAKKNVHVVQSGETLGGIALKHGVRLAALATANGLSTKSGVRIGQELVIPVDPAAKRADAPKTITYAVKSGDTLSGVAKKHGCTVTELEKLNGMSRKATLRVGQTLQIPAK